MPCILRFTEKGPEKKLEHHSRLKKALKRDWIVTFVPRCTEERVNRKFCSDMYRGETNRELISYFESIKNLNIETGGNFERFPLVENKCFIRLTRVDSQGIVSLLFKNRQDKFSCHNESFSLCYNLFTYFNPFNSGLYLLSKY